MIIKNTTIPAYTLDYSDSGLIGKASFYIQPDTFNDTSTSLRLFGRGYSKYGECINKNFVNLLENFASRSPPPNPTIGQLWFDGNTNQLKVYDSSQTWVQVGAQTTTMTPTSDLILTSHPSQEMQAATKGYVDRCVSNTLAEIISHSQPDDTYVRKTGDRISGQLIIDETSILLNNVITKEYVESLISGVAVYSHPTEDGNGHVPSTGYSNEGKVLTAGNAPGSYSWKSVTIQQPAELTIPVYSYSDRHQLRSTTGTLVVVNHLGIFAWSEEEGSDDDQTCFVSNRGCWEMVGVGAKYISQIMDQKDEESCIANEPLPPPLDLPQLKLNAITTISNQLGVVSGRLNHDDIYKERLNESIDFISEDCPSDLTSFPLTRLSVELTGKSGQDVAQAVLEQHSYWLRLVMELERVRMTYTQAINECVTEDQLTQVTQSLMDVIDTIH